MNSTLSNTSIKCVRDTSVTAVVFPCLYSILFVVALILNSLAAWIFFNIPSSSTFVVFLKNVVRHQGFGCFTFVCAEQQLKQTLSLTGGGWLADDPDHPSESLKRCRCGFLATARLPLPILCRSLLHHHVHQHPLAGSHQPGSLPEDSQALWEVCPAAGSCWSDPQCSHLGGHVVFSVTQRYSEWPAATGLWRQTEVHLHEEQSWHAVAWRIQLLLSGSYWIMVVPHFGWYTFLPRFRREGKYHSEGVINILICQQGSEQADFINVKLLLQYHLI